MARNMCFGNRRDFTLEVVFYRVDRTVRSEKLYLDPKLTLPVLADMAGTNRTYASRAVCSIPQLQGLSEWAQSRASAEGHTGR